VRSSARRSAIVALAVVCVASALALPQLALSQSDGADGSPDISNLVENPTDGGYAPERVELEATPAEGPTGTRIHVSGDGCLIPGTDERADAVLARLVAADGSDVFTAQLAVADDGTWHGELAAPAGTPAGELQATARCVAPELEVRHYGPTTHTVTGEGSAAATASLPPTNTVPVQDPSLATAAPGSVPDGLGGASTAGFAGAAEENAGAAGLPTFHNPGAAIERLPAYDGQTTCSPTDKPGTQQFRGILREAFPTALGNISRACSAGGQSEHMEGRAYDWPIDAFDNGEYAWAVQAIDWLLATDSRGNTYANARRLGVMYIIFNNQMFRLYDVERGWRPYTGSNPHTDHVHYSLTRAGGNGTTSWYTAPPDPCRGQTYEPFCDISPNHQFNEEIMWVADEGIANGYDDTSFRPLDAVSRQAMAAFLYRLAGSPTYTPPATPTYADVRSSHPFRKEIEWLRREGIGSGYEDGTFRGTAPVSRQAMAAFMFRAADAPAGYRAPTTPRFTDTAVGRPFYREIHWLADEDISTGYSDGTFRPDANVSRQAMAAFLMRLDPLV
jgi:hypothetical protein